MQGHATSGRRRCPQAIGAPIGDKRGGNPDILDRNALMRWVTMSVRVFALAAACVLVRNAQLMRLMPDRLRSPSPACHPR
ncbi:hypothetical protein [Lysobacter gummosus]|uniref:hypothetical protein n=1 Tax=Lysobacter gummosus TaxID=262324 RepID=UPI0036330A4C